MEEGWAFLEDEAIIDPEEQFDADVLAGALVQITLMDGMAPKASHAVRSVVLMLAQLRFNTTAGSMLEKMEAKVDTLVDKVVERAMAAIRPQSVEIDMLVAAVMEVQEKLTEVAAMLIACRYEWGH